MAGVCGAVDPAAPVRAPAVGGVATTKFGACRGCGTILRGAGFSGIAGAAGATVVAAGIAAAAAGAGLAATGAASAGRATTTAAGIGRPAGEAAAIGRGGPVTCAVSRCLLSRIALATSPT